MSMIESLEPRVLLSASPFNATVALDRLIVRGDLLKFRADIFVCEGKLLLDLKAIRKNTAKGDTSLVAPLQKLRADAKAMRTTLLEDRLAEAANALADESVIKLDRLQILKDRGNASAEAADHAKLLTDRIKLQNDLIAGLDSRIATRQADEATISADAGAIVTAATNDPNASAALKAAAATFATDRTGCLNTLQADLQVIATARAKLAADLTAEQSM